MPFRLAPPRRWASARYASPVLKGLGTAARESRLAGMVRQHRRRWLALLLGLLFVVGVVGVDRTTVRIRLGDSTLRQAAPGDWLIADRGGPVARGDVALIEYCARYGCGASDPNRGSLIVYRVLAVAGDELGCDRQRRILVNGQRLAGHRMAESDPYSWLCSNDYVHEVAPRQLVLLGRQGTTWAGWSDDVVGRGVVTWDGGIPQWIAPEREFVDAGPERAGARIPPMLSFGALAASAAMGLLALVGAWLIRQGRRLASYWVNGDDAPIGFRAGLRRLGQDSAAALARRSRTFWIACGLLTFFMCGGAAAVGTAQLAYVYPYETTMGQTVPGGSWVVADRMGSLRRGDVVLVLATALRAAETPRRPWPAAAGVQLVVTRVVALPGDRVRCCDLARRISVNLRPFHERYRPGTVVRQDLVVSVPAGHVLVAGDSEQIFWLARRSAVTGRVVALKTGSVGPYVVGTPNALQQTGLAPRGERTAAPLVALGISASGLFGLAALGLWALARRLRAPVGRLLRRLRRAAGRLPRAARLPAPSRHAPPSGTAAPSSTPGWLRTVRRRARSDVGRRR